MPPIGMRAVGRTESVLNRIDAYCQASRQFANERQTFMQFLLLAEMTQPE